MVIDAYLSAATTVRGLLHSPALPPAWERESVLPGFTVGGLAGHLARAVFTTEGYLDGTAPPGVQPIDAATYLTMIATLTPEDNRRVVTRGEEDALGGPEALRSRYDEALAHLRSRLPEVPEDRPLPVFAGKVLPLGEYLITRLVELLVHADDLAASLDVPTPPFDDASADLVVVLLTRQAHRQHGTSAMLRSLTRPSRANPTPAF